MKTFCISRPGLFANSHPQEDYSLTSKKYPIFVVADGVTLNFDNEKDYPKGSGASQAAKIFCETVITEAEKRYENFIKQDIKHIFNLGNEAVRKFNESQNRAADTINYWDKDLFSATTAFALIKDNKLYWWSLCDSGVMLFDKKGKKLFASPGGWVTCKKNLPKDWNTINEKEKVKMLHKDYRNVVDEGGAPIGYGVVDGEETATVYLNHSIIDTSPGDLIFIYTDGFENYFNHKEFINIFENWPKNMEQQVEKFLSEKSKEDTAKYGSEKTLIATSV